MRFSNTKLLVTDIKNSIICITFILYWLVNIICILLRSILLLYDFVLDSDLTIVLKYEHFGTEIL